LASLGYSAVTLGGFIARQRSPAGRPRFDYVEVIFTADALGKIYRQFLAPLPDLHVVG
jgi:hypothetical protein